MTNDTSFHVLAAHVTPDHCLVEGDYRSRITHRYPIVDPEGRVRTAIETEDGSLHLREPHAPVEVDDFYDPEVRRLLDRADRAAQWYALQERRAARRDRRSANA